MAPTGCTPAVGGNRVFFGTEGSSFFAIDWQEAKIAWTMQVAAQHAVPLVGRRDRRRRDLRRPRQAWCMPSIRPTARSCGSSPREARVDSSPVIVGIAVFVGSSDGRLYALDRKTGKKVWEYEAGGDFVASPAVADGRLVIGNTDGTLYCFGSKNVTRETTACHQFERAAA